ncbi:biotin transporter BioY [Ferrovibrio sp. MS7]|uniref:biotin transporter BioY n=1 Tax=Ferrovibrio plantarum TaxID=3119164 RepID=UPI0031350CDC
MTTTTLNPTLLQHVAPGMKAWRVALAMLAGSALLAISAKVQVPFWPVPMTLQTLAILAIGMAFGSRLGAATVLLYLAEGFVGLPVFAGAAAGPAYFAGPTAGYLIGFVASAWLIGWLAERGWDRSLLRCLIAMAVGHAVVFVFGVSWLATLVGVQKALAAGLYPFWAATLVKTLLGVAVMQAAWHLALKRRSLG